MTVETPRTLDAINAELAATIELRDAAAGAKKGMFTRKVTELTAERDTFGDNAPDDDSAALTQRERDVVTDAPPKAMPAAEMAANLKARKAAKDPDPKAANDAAALAVIHAEPTITAVLTGVRGLGASTVAKAIADVDMLAADTIATPEQIKRARQSRKPANLKGKALATWVITGEKPGKPAATTPRTPKAPATPKAPFALPDGMTDAQALVKYVTENISDDPNAAGLAKPFITAKGRLFVHNVWFRNWLANLTGTTVPAGYASKVLKDMGFKHRSLPVVGAATTRMAIWITDDLPRGTGSLKRQPAVDTK